MATIRFKALEDLYHRSPKYTNPPSDKVSDFFGESVFGEFAMRQHLTPEVYTSVKEAVSGGVKLDRDMAEVRLFLDRLERFTASLKPEDMHRPDVASAL